MKGLENWAPYACSDACMVNRKLFARCALGLILQQYICCMSSVSLFRAKLVREHCPGFRLYICCLITLDDAHLGCRIAKFNKLRCHCNL